MSMWEIVSSVFFFMALPAFVFTVAVACGVNAGRIVTALYIQALRGAGMVIKNERSMIPLGWVIGSFVTIGLAWIFMQFVVYVRPEGSTVPKGFWIILTILSSFGNLFQGAPTSPDSR